MGTEVLTLDSSKGYREQVARAATLIREGKLVGFPTETVYGVAARADRREAVDALRQAKGQRESKPFTVHLGRPQDVHRFVPSMTGLASRLIAKGWPGPLTLVLDVDDPFAAEVVRESGPETASLIYFEGTVGLRCPDDEIASALLIEAAVPVVAASANRSNRPPPRSAEGVNSELNGTLELILDGGQARYAKPSTVVKVQGDRYEVLREGVYDRRGVSRLASLEILLICSGNTCRSPMAAALCASMVAEKLGVDARQLGDRNVVVSSAGTSASLASPPTPEAVAVMSEQGLDISSHLSHPLTTDDVTRADYVFCMTPAHVDAVLSLVPGSARKVKLLAADGEIADPIGADQDVYRACALRMRQALAQRLSEIEI